MKYFILLTFTITLTGLMSCNAQKKKDNSKIENPKSSTETKINNSDTIGQLMLEDNFWKLIENSKSQSNNNYQTQIKSLKEILTKLDTIEIIKFDNTFTSLLVKSYDYKLWGASYVINGGCSDDCFDYFREYLIAHGKDKFYATIKNPESCVSWIKSEEEDNWEGIRYSATEAYKIKTGRDLTRNYLPKFELKGKQFDEENVNKQYPKLAKKFMER